MGAQEESVMAIKVGDFVIELATPWPAAGISNKLLPIRENASPMMIEEIKYMAGECWYCLRNETAKEYLPARAMKCVIV